MSSRSQGGFTLLELLIAVTILGLIVVALTGGVRFAGQAWQAQAKQSQRYGDLDAVQNVLRQLIASAKDFRGDAVSLHFVGAMPEALARGGLYDIELRTLAGRLVLAWKPHFRGQTADGVWNTATLAQGVSAFAFTYYVPPGGWQSTAANRNRPPALVRIALGFDDSRTWPPLTIAPMIESRPGVMN
jgi:general secretion pathway protein J